jgi:hypothetical protein
MINSIQLLRNVGLFDSVSGAANFVPLRLTLVYAENGRGKTTFAAILRSLATGDPLPIAERQRLAAQHPPHIILECSGGTLVKSKLINIMIDRVSCLYPDVGALIFISGDDK